MRLLAEQEREELALLMRERRLHWKQPEDPARVQGGVTRGCTAVNGLASNLGHHAIDVYRGIPYSANDEFRKLRDRPGLHGRGDPGCGHRIQAKVDQVMILPATVRFLLPP